MGGRVPPGKNSNHGVKHAILRLTGDFSASAIYTILKCSIKITHSLHARYPRIKELQSTLYCGVQKTVTNHNPRKHKKALERSKGNRWNHTSERWLSQMKLFRQSSCLGHKYMWVRKVSYWSRMIKRSYKDQKSIRSEIRALTHLQYGVRVYV